MLLEIDGATGMWQAPPLLHSCHVMTQEKLTFC